MAYNQYSGASSSKISNPFVSLAVVLGIAFALSGAASFVGLLSSIPVSSGTSERTSDAEVVMLNTATGRIIDFGLTVPRADAQTAKLDLNGDYVTFFSGGEFQTYDISNMVSKDNYAPSNYQPTTDPYKANGHYLAVYSSYSSTLLVRETVPQSQSAPREERLVPVPSAGSDAKLMASDGDIFYWVADDTSGIGSVIYKYDHTNNVTTQIHKSKSPITDISASGGYLAYAFTWNRVPRIISLDTATGKTSTFCVDCTKPRMGGRNLAALGVSEILVQNMSTNKKQDIHEDKEVLDIRVDDDRVAWSWFETVDPITVQDLKTGKKYDYQPDHMVYTFAMSGNNILMLRSKALLPTTGLPVSDAVRIPLGFMGATLFGMIFMSGMALALDKQRRREATEAWQKEWNDWYQANGAQAAEYYRYYYGYYQYPTTPQSNYYY